MTTSIATGLYSNWDSVVEVDQNLLNWVFQSIRRRPRGLILDDIDEVTYVLSEAFLEGGREVLISKDLYLQLDTLFKARKKVLGGNGFNMGKTLYELGIVPLVSFPYRSRALMTSSPDLWLADEGRLKKPVEVIREEDPDYDHIVFEFDRDPEFGINKSGRQIFSWDPMSTNGIFDHDFLNYVSESGDIRLIALGYAHLLLPGYKTRTDEILDHLDRPDRPRIHLEFGSGSEPSLRYAMKRFADRGLADSWGMNEDECSTFLDAESIEVEDLVEASLAAIREYGLTRICVHSIEYVFSISKLSFEKEATALEFGCTVSAASTLGSITQNIEKARRLPRSKIQTVKRRIDGYNLCLIPTYRNLEPLKVVGIGDVFTAAQAYYSLG